MSTQDPACRHQVSTKVHEKSKAKCILFFIPTVPIVRTIVWYRQSALFPIGLLGNASAARRGVSLGLIEATIAPAWIKAVPADLDRFLYCT
jgi:hypothetical protein